MLLNPLNPVLLKPLNPCVIKTFKPRVIETIKPLVIDIAFRCIGHVISPIFLREHWPFLWSVYAPQGLAYDSLLGLGTGLS